jgi:type VI secretion system protein ImpB
MAKSSGSIAPKERINIKYVPATGDNTCEVELPLKLLVMGDFRGQNEDRALEERQVVNIDKDNFDEVLAKAEVGLNLSVPLKLNQAAGEELAVNLRFEAIGDFGPDAIAQQVPEMRKLLALRAALVALKGPMGNVPAFRKRLQALLADDGGRERLSRELGMAPSTD